MARLEGQRNRTRSGARVLLVDLAPDLAALLGRNFPGAEIHLAGQADALDRLLLASWDVLVVDLDTIRLGQVLPHLDRLPVVGVTSSADRARDHGGLADVLLRPVLGEDLHRTVGRLLGQAAGTSPEERRLAKLRAALPVAKLAGLASGLTVDLATGGPRLAMFVAAVAVLLTLTGLRARTSAAGRSWAAAEVALACSLLLLSGGPESSYLLHALVLAVDAGLRFRPRHAAIAVGALLVATAPGGVTMLSHAGGRQTWTAVAVVLASVATIATLVRRIWRAELDGAMAELDDVHSALVKVLELGPGLAGGLTLPDAADVLLEEVSTRWSATCGIALVEHAGTFVESGSTGLSAHGPVVLEATDPLAIVVHESRRPRGVADVAVPDVLRLAAPSADPWILTPLHHDGVPVGALLWASRRHLTERTRLELRPFARRAGLTVATARRFEQLRAVATDRDRRRLREALEHDVLQSVLSLRYELELAARQDDAAVGPQLDRLSAVARDVAAHVRATAGRLGTEVDARGLGAALRNHCRDLQRLTEARLEIDLQTERRAERDAEVVIYELATGAIHRAVASAHVTRVDVRILDRGRATVVEVEHDGLASSARDPELARRTAQAAEFGVSLEVDASAGRSLTRIRAVPLGLPMDGVAS